MNGSRIKRLRAVLRRRQPDLTVLMERVNKPHNLSAILRSCDAAGVFRVHVVLPPGGISLSNHVSGGASKWVRIQTHDTAQEAIQHLKKEEFRILAAHPTRRARDFKTVDFTRPVALMVGAELEGLSDESVSAADETLVIPMEGMARSLNVSVATAIILFEAQRQRSVAGMYQSPRLDPEEEKKVLFEWAHPELARVLKEKNLPYPPLTEEGDPLLEPGALQD